MMEDMGVDLGLMQLEFEVNQMTKKLEKTWSFWVNACFR
jgi:hypothetical protein